jgi:PadR family transcriptional regulator PadR
MAPKKTDVMQGTLDLMVLKTLDALGPLHGYGIARRIEQVSEDAFALNQGTLYPALTRLERHGWISSSWGASDNNRRARFYAITRTGKKQLAQETRNWNRIAGVIGRLLGES